MREIKFRVWNTISKTMGSFAEIKRCAAFAMANGLNSNDFIVLPLNNSILNQFTGLLDKNGVEIYEGDIVDFGVTTNIKEVVFDGDSASFRVYEYLYEQGSLLAEKWFLDDCDGIEVIGNIYENPELLEMR